jgi:methionine-S-sulfoxide reductase
MEKLEKIMFAAGCFWGVEQTFRMLRGVVNTSVGYSGGHTKNPTYEDVCSHRTGHAEVVLVEFNPNSIKLEDLILIFFRCHDPTQLNRQGPDVGDQYRSAIFYFSEEQKKTAERIKNELTVVKKFSKPIVTEISPAKEFYPAEDYHQQYVEKNPQRPCHVYIARDFLKNH